MAKCGMNITVEPDGTTRQLCVQKFKGGPHELTKLGMLFEINPPSDGPQMASNA